MSKRTGKCIQCNGPVPPNPSGTIPLTCSLACRKLREAAGRQAAQAGYRAMRAEKRAERLAKNPRVAQPRSDVPVGVCKNCHGVIAKPLNKNGAPRRSCSQECSIALRQAASVRASERRIEAANERRSLAPRRHQVINANQPAPTRRKRICDFCADLCERRYECLGADGTCRGCGEPPGKERAWPTHGSVSMLATATRWA